MTEDWFDAEIGRLRAESFRAETFPYAALWSAMLPALAAQARAKRRWRLAASGALAAMAFAAGVVAHVWVARPPGAPSAGSAQSSLALEVQRAGSELIAQLAFARTTLERDEGGAAARQAHRVGVSVLAGAAAELTRMDPSNDRLAEILRVGIETRGALDSPNR